MRQRGCRVYGRVYHKIKDDDERRTQTQIDGRGEMGRTGYKQRAKQALSVYRQKSDYDG